jgi:hypothetical protein
MIQQISDYFKKHEALILGVGVLSLVLFLGNKWLNHRVQIADAANIQAQAALEQQKEKVAELTAVVQSAKATSDAAVAQANAQSLLLQKEIVALQASLAKQQAEIKVKPLPELTAQWNTLIGIPDGVVNTDKGLVVSEPAARTTVSELVEIPVLQETIDDQSKEMSAKDDAIVAQAKTISANEKLISGLNIQISDEKTACTKQVNLATAKAKISKRNWFIAGFVAGIGTRLLAHF